MFECKKGCFELFGFDLMVDDEFNMWLIEVNSSPAMDYSTKVTERLVKMVLEDTVKVVVDYANAKKKKKVDTGKF
jgi:tubulin monoglycylase TTLL3/8